MKRIVLSQHDRKLTGLCGGLGDYFEIDPTLVRLAVLVICILSFPIGPIAYFVAAAIVPKGEK